MKSHYSRCFECGKRKATCNKCSILVMNLKNGKLYPVAINPNNK